ncbi:Oidioi.mRNA.OKI2018_I69.PAR.g10432.t1.cds [Oikopleura dioica]|nr:Oidioi.mRNA.OKI2018_I69.PAR.g10432.t1.cds [Oikopleura dioica]
MFRIRQWFSNRRRRYRNECPAQQVSNQPIQTALCPSNAPTVPTMVPSPSPTDSPPTSCPQEFNAGMTAHDAQFMQESDATQQAQIYQNIGPQQYFDVQEIHQQANSSGGNSPNESGCYSPLASAPVPEAAQEQIYSVPINPPSVSFSPEDSFQQYFML